MTSIILTETHLYADQQVSTPRDQTHECKDCSSQNVQRVRQKECSKIVVPDTDVTYRGSKVLALACSGNSILIKKMVNVVLAGKCPVRIITDFQMLFDFKPNVRCSMLIVTEARAFRLVISGTRVELGEVKTYPVVIGSGAPLAKAIWTLFPKLKPLQVMSTLIAHDPSTGVAVDRFKYTSAKRKIKHFHLQDLPAPLKDLQIPE